MSIPDTELYTPIRVHLAGSDIPMPLGKHSKRCRISASFKQILLTANDPVQPLWPEAETRIYGFIVAFVNPVFVGSSQADTKLAIQATGSNGVAQLPFGIRIPLPTTDALWVGATTNTTVTVCAFYEQPEI